MVVDVKNIYIKGVNVVARKAAKEKKNEALYKVRQGWISSHLSRLFGGVLEFQRQS